MSTAELLAPGAVTTVVLFASRVGGLLLIAPVFSSRTVPMAVRTALLVLLTWLLAPVAVRAQAGAPALTPAAMLTETLVGLAIGLGAALLVGAAEAMGDLLAVNIGLSGASVLDPLTAYSVPVLGQFTNLLALTLLLSSDAHLLMLDALSASTRLLPVGAPLDAQAGFATMAGLGSMLFALGLRFAAPVIAVVLLANTALAILTRVAPQVNVLSIAFPLQIGVGLLALLASLPLLAGFFTGWEGFYDEILGRVFGALAGGR